LPGEVPFNAWRTGRGYLVLTNLRCVALAQESLLFHRRPWTMGPEFFFYNLRSPRVLFGRFVELAEEYEENGWVARFVVQHPESVAATISAQLDAGKAAWHQRRQNTESLIAARSCARAERAAGGPRSPVRVRCGFCGNLANVARRTCPSCGAILG
jgi:hypothetical protein